MTDEPKNERVDYFVASAVNQHKQSSTANAESAPPKTAREHARDVRTSTVGVAQASGRYLADKTRPARENKHVRRGTALLIAAGLVTVGFFASRVGSNNAAPSSTDPTADVKPAPTPPSLLEKTDTLHTPDGYTTVPAYSGIDGNLFIVGDKLPKNTQNIIIPTAVKGGKNVVALTKPNIGEVNYDNADIVVIHPAFLKGTQANADFSFGGPNAANGMKTPTLRFFDVETQQLRSQIGFNSKPPKEIWVFDNNGDPHIIPLKNVRTEQDWQNIANAINSAFAKLRSEGKELNEEEMVEFINGIARVLSERVEQPDSPARITHTTGSHAARAGRHNGAKPIVPCKAVSGESKPGQPFTPTQGFKGR